MSTPTGGVLRYPYEAITQNTDYLQIRIFKYEKATPSASGTNNPYIGGPKSYASSAALDASNYVSNKAKVLEPGGVIILPMPSNIQDSNVVSYDNDSMNTFAAEGALAVQQAMAGTGKAISESLSSTAPMGGSEAEQKTYGDTMAGIAKKIRDLASDPRTLAAVNTRLAVQAVNVFAANVSFNSLLARSEGKILNPNMELLFNNVTLRTFRFSFKFAPRDKNEATVVKSIIRTLKKNMAARTAKDANGIFLSTPHLFKLTYRKGNQNHPFLHRFKDCALSDMSVQYTGDNVYATYADGTPVSMVMNLTFKELTPIYNEDYDKDDSGNAMPDPKDGPQSNLIYGVNDGNSSKDVEGVGF